MNPSSDHKLLFRAAVSKEPSGPRARPCSLDESFNYRELSVDEFIVHLNQHLENMQERTEGGVEREVKQWGESAHMGKRR